MLNPHPCFPVQPRKIIAHCSLLISHSSLFIPHCLNALLHTKTFGIIPLPGYSVEPGKPTSDIGGKKTTMEHKKIKIYRIRGTALLSAVLAVLFIITGCTGGKRDGDGCADRHAEFRRNADGNPDPRPHFAEVNLPFEPTLNYFAAPEAVLEVLTENELQGYPAVVAAYMNYETGVDLPGSKDDYPNLLRLIDMYFPVFFADIYDTTVRFSEGENGCRLEWSYFSSSREEHNTLFHRFETRVAELLKPSEGAKSRINAGRCGVSKS